MPYIGQKRRDELMTGRYKIKTPGELNFVFHTAIANYLSSEDTNYQSINDVIGALECAKQEFYRRTVVPYEETKIKENGDCQPYDPIA